MSANIEHDTNLPEGHQVPEHHEEVVTADGNDNAAQNMEEQVNNDQAIANEQPTQNLGNKDENKDNGGQLVENAVTHLVQDALQNPSLLTSFPEGGKEQEKQNEQTNPEEQIKQEDNHVDNLTHQPTEHQEEKNTENEAEIKTSQNVINEDGKPLENQAEDKELDKLEEIQKNQDRASQKLDEPTGGHNSHPVIPDEEHKQPKVEDQENKVSANEIDNVENGDVKVESQKQIQNEKENENIQPQEEGQKENNVVEGKPVEGETNEPQQEIAPKELTKEEIATQVLTSIINKATGTPDTEEPENNLQQHEVPAQNGEVINTSAKAVSKLVQEFQGEEVSQKDEEARSRAAKDLEERKRKIEEIKKIKQNFEAQLKSLDQELVVLETGEKVPSRLGQKDKKSHSTTNKSAKQLGPLIVGGKKMSSDHGVPANGTASVPKFATHKADGERLYERMEKEYQQNRLLPELEKRKEELRAKKELYKPIDTKQFREHELKYKDAIRKEQLNKEVARIEANEQIAEKERERIKALTKSNVLKKLKEREKEERERSDKQAAEAKNLRDRQAKYGQLVKEMYFPKQEISKPDLIARENLRHIIEESEAAGKDGVKTFVMKEKKPIREFKSNPTSAGLWVGNTSKDIIKESLDELRGLRNYINENKKKNDILAGLEDVTHHSPRRTELEDKPEQKAPVPKPKKVIKKIVPKDVEEPPKVVQAPEEKRKQYPNYLAEQKKQREKEGRAGHQQKYHQWSKYMKKEGLTEQEKIMNILDDVQRIEHQAKIKEARLKHSDHPRGYEPEDLEEEVGEMYLESIKAKLAIIKGLQK